MTNLTNRQYTSDELIIRLVHYENLYFSATGSSLSVVAHLRVMASIMGFSMDWANYRTIPFKIHLAGPYLNHESIRKSANSLYLPLPTSTIVRSLLILSKPLLILSKPLGQAYQHLQGRKTSFTKGIILGHTVPPGVLPFPRGHHPFHQSRLRLLHHGLQTCHRSRLSAAHSLF